MCHMLDKGGHGVGNTKGTAELKDLLDKASSGSNPTFQKIPGGLGAAQPGDAIVTPSREGKGGKVTGHTGVVGKDGRIISNNSRYGKVLDHHTKDTWHREIESRGGGLPTYVYRPL
jgi:hypothetical protein